MNNKKIYPRSIFPIVFLLISMLFAYTSQAQFITKWKTTTDGESITIPTKLGSTYNYSVDWGDGSTISTGQTGNATHTYATAGTHTVSITGTFPQIIFFQNGLSKNKIVEVSQWGTNAWTSMANAFDGCLYLNITATDVPVLSGVTDMSYMFRFCGNLNPTGPAATALNSWNTGAVTDMAGMFLSAKSFNQNIGGWNTAAVTNMSEMFEDAEEFNQNIGNWNTGAVTRMGSMFLAAFSFNQDIGSWNTGAVEEMYKMFRKAQSFNQNIGGWNTGAVKNMRDMFLGATVFNQNIGGWNITAVTTMEHMLNNTALSTTNYDNTLIGWAAQAPKMYVPLGATTLKYCAGAAARSTLTTTYRWTVSGDVSDCSGAFITKWITTAASENITIPTFSASTYSYNVDWGDGSTISTGQTGNATHTYATAGTYTVSITGTFPQIYFNKTGDKDKIVEISQWGTNAWTSMANAFYGCTNLNIAATDAPVLSGITDMSYMFAGCTSLNPTGEAATKINTWNTSSVTDMQSLFDGAIIFNQDIGGWNTGSVENMESVFEGAANFDQNIGGWNTGALLNMQYMFRGATNFNQDIGSWNTASVTGMFAMFNKATSFNQNIGNWNTAAVTDMSSMFAGASSFNQNIGNWNTGAVKLMASMFSQATYFNQNIGNWNTGAVEDMHLMFFLATSFNQDIGGWNTSAVKNMKQMFQAATSFNQNIGSWTTGAVTDMSEMFFGANSFNQNIGGWNITAVTTMENMLGNTALSITNYDNTLIGWAGQVPKMNVSLGATSLKYCAGAAAHSILTTTYGWTISDDGLDCSTPFITKWETTSDGESITIPAAGSGFNYNIDWGDGNLNTSETGIATHIYSTAGIYTVTITGDFPRIYFNNTGDKDKIIEISQWGSNAWTTMAYAFYGCTNLNITATDAPTLSGLTDLPLMFSDCSSLNPTGAAATAFETWNTSAVTEMSGMFRGATSFNQNISSWNTSAVTDMGTMFRGATSFNQNIGSWNVSAVSNITGMFYGATSFNQDIGSWNTSAATNMSGMFYGATDFNQNIANWNTSAVMDMTDMFNGAKSFNQNIGGWNTSAVIYMRSMFNGATDFNQNIGGWNTGAVTNMSSMFRGAISFDQNIGGWNTGAVTNMTGMFLGATVFNQNIGSWDTHSAVYTFRMFDGAISFNQNIGNWITSAVTDMSYMFNGATSFNQNLGGWNISSVTNMTGMLDNSGMSRFFYDKIVKGWATQTVQNNVTLGALNVRYCNSFAERDDLHNNNGWTFAGDIYDCSVLPLELTNFTVQKSGTDAVKINWASGVESNIASMAVQHSSNAEQWETIYSCSPTGSNSNYEAYDTHPVAGNNYYRLMTTDKDGSQTYSEIKLVTFSTSLLPNVYPNPTSGSLTISNIKTGDMITLTDVTGRQLLKKQASTEKEMLDIHSLGQGMYFISIMRDGKIVVNEKITKLN